MRCEMRLQAASDAAHKPGKCSTHKRPPAHAHVVVVVVAVLADAVVVVVGCCY